MNYYNEIKENLIKSEIYDKVRDYSKDRNKVKVYFETGKLLSEAGKEYGKNIIKQYSEKLMIDVGKKYNERNLRYMRRFYEIFKNSNWNPLGSNLTWTNIRITLPVKSIEAIKYYVDVSEKYNLSKRKLEEIIKNHEYERLPIETRKKLINKDPVEVKDLILNPIIIRTKQLKMNISECALKELILNNLDNFLLQLGFGFTYVGNEYKIKLGSKYNYIDLLLYNIKYKCYVVVELKVTELKKEHTGQIMTYMNYIDKNIKTIDENDTVGIIICKQDNEYVIRYCSDDRIIAREYELV
jgi:predicted nuclease of restriction endonuclease-like (RecB) superfamily